MLDTTHAHAISDEGLHFWPTPCQIQPKGLHFRLHSKRRGCISDFPSRADAISDEGVAFSADSLPISDEGVAFSAAFQANGVAFFDHWHGGGVHF